MASNLQVTLKNLKNSVIHVRLATKGALAATNNQNVANLKSEGLHISAKHDYPQAQRLPLPVNINPAETAKFSPQRTRDINASAILTHGSIMGFPNRIDITVDNSSKDSHIQSYDCSGAVSLNSSMQSNVPSPFGGMHKFSHLNMPGGQWEQESKFLAQDLKASHYVSLRKSARSEWGNYEENYNKRTKGIVHEIRNSNKSHGILTKACVAFWHVKRNVKLYSTESHVKKDDVKDVKDDVSSNEKKCRIEPLSRKEMLKRAVKDYGSTVIIFHVGISLISLGSFYLLVSSGLDIVGILQNLNLGETALSNKLATGASTFVVAYAVHKVFAPVRISITLGATPFIVRYLRNKGFLKKPKTS